MFPPGRDAAEAFCGLHLTQWRVRILADASSDAHGRVVWTDPGGTKISRLGEQIGRFEIALEGILTVRVDLEARRAEVVPVSDGVTDRTIRHFWFAQVAPRLIASEGRLVLHGAVLQRGGCAVVFLGPSGAGKSTLAASLSRSGWGLAGDDGAVLSLADGRWMAASVDPSLRLLQDSADALIGDDAQLQPTASYSAKRAVSMHHAASEPLPLAGIWLLEQSADIRTAPLAPGQACMTLIENSFRLDPSDARSAADTLALAASVVESTPCARLAYPRRYEALAAVRECLEAALAAERSRARSA